MYCWAQVCQLELDGYACFFLGRRGIFTGASGLQIAYVSGRESQQEPAPSHCFTRKDLSALVAPLLSNSKFRGVDILLSSQWPRGVWQYGNSPVSALLCLFNTFLRYFLIVCLRIVYFLALFRKLIQSIVGFRPSQISLTSWSRATILRDWKGSIMRGCPTGVLLQHQEMFYFFFKCFLSYKMCIHLQESCGPSTECSACQ